MAKKSFKSLPKRAQKAAFAEMDKNGTRRSKQKSKPKSGVTFSAENSKRLNTLRSAKSAARALVANKIAPLRQKRDAALNEARQFEAIGAAGPARKLRNEAKSTQGKINKAAEKLSAINSAARSVKVNKSRTKQGKLF